MQHLRSCSLFHDCLKEYFIRCLISKSFSWSVIEAIHCNVGMFRVSPCFQLKQLKETCPPSAALQALAHGSSSIMSSRCSSPKVKSPKTSHQHARVLATFQAQCLLWAENTSQRRRGYGKSGPLYHPRPPALETHHKPCSLSLTQQQHML